MFDFQNLGSALSLGQSEKIITCIEEGEILEKFIWKYLSEFIWLRMCMRDDSEKYGIWIASLFNELLAITSYLKIIYSLQPALVTWYLYLFPTILNKKLEWYFVIV